MLSSFLITDKNRVSLVSEYDENIVLLLDRPDSPLLLDLLRKETPFYLKERHGLVIRLVGLFYRT